MKGAWYVHVTRIPRTDGSDGIPPVSSQERGAPPWRLLTFLASLLGYPSRHVVVGPVGRPLGPAGAGPTVSASRAVSVRVLLAQSATSSWARARRTTTTQVTHRVDLADLATRGARTRVSGDGAHRAILPCGPTRTVRGGQGGGGGRMMNGGDGEMNSVVIEIWEEQAIKASNCSHLTMAVLVIWLHYQNGDARTHNVTSKYTKTVHNLICWW